MATAVAPSIVDMLRVEVDRFMEAARKRSESDPNPQRRTHRRYHRSWPLCLFVNGSCRSAALHNASSGGVALLSAAGVPAGTRVFLRLFCHNEETPWVPAVVRHCTPTDHGHLIGCEFALANEELCRAAADLAGQAVTV